MRPFMPEVGIDPIHARFYSAVHNYFHVRVWLP
jgi:hypothetical protein